MKHLLSAAALLFCWISGAQITVDPGRVLGPVKPMNAVNNGPVVASSKEQTRGNFTEYKALHIPFARTHDAASFEGYGGPHSVDISQLFPDFSRDPDDPSAYDFTNTDVYLQSIVDAGTQVFFRLGETIEHTARQYHVFPPSDFLKWAKVCEHVILHYNEGWADGLHLGIRYWEIWNEPDLDMYQWETKPRTWAGTPETFFRFYETVANYLSGRFPNLMIGGPALCGREEWAEMFLPYMRDHKVELDFFSWHTYTTSVEDIVAKAGRIRAMLDKYGFAGVPSILNEWNYIKGWTEDYVYSLEEINSLKGAAFTAAMMSACQDGPVDMLMYYDFRLPSAFSGAFDQRTYRPTKGYYPFYAWDKLVQFGTQVAAASEDGQVRVTAAKDASGHVRALVVRFNRDNNVTNPKPYRIRLQGGGSGTVYAYVTDDVRTYTEIPLEMKDGEVEITLDPNSFTLIDFGK